jgi:hypothetical protein
MIDRLYTSEHRLLNYEGYSFKIKPYFEEFNNFESDSVYLKGDFYYQFRGTAETDKQKKPGIYYDPKLDKFVMNEVTPYNCNPDDYIFSDSNVWTTNTQSIIDIINNDKVQIITFPDSGDISIPPPDEKDDILKKLMKQALIAKKVPINLCKDRFDDKNKLFNFKSVLKSDKPLSKLLFDRAVEALGLKYTIILEEADTNSLIIGAPLIEPIILSSADSRVL